ncbi:hypothetical protein F8388_022854 [Cannabis sativa]|uniref:Ubiquitin-like protease family profile domain-containing protein n=1 Tax=Cannabis sativa TaxID=3483 RepID=A0A7J6FBZ3_CANSA|nr:hypothetical protein F8388_022854 [Cannabis sativa]
MSEYMETENKWRIHMENEINDLKYELASLSYLKEEVKALKALMLENELHPMVIKKIDLIVVFGGNYLQHSDFRYLGPETWVELSVIAMISLFLTEEERRRSESLPYRDLPLHEVWREMDYYNIFMGILDFCKEIYIPILSSSHYCLARVIISLKTVEVWDSLVDEKSPVRQSNKIKEILRNLDLAMANQIKKRLSTFSFASFCIRRAQNVPRQLNSFDCGVFVALFMIHRCRLDDLSR